MQVTRFYTTPDGGSTFDEVNIPLDDGGTDAWDNTLLFSAAFQSPAVRVYEPGANTFQDWHNAPRRQLCVVLKGVWEVGTTDGQKRRWGPGEVFMPDTVVGKGHTSEVLEAPCRMFFIPLPDDFDILAWQQ